ncbi:MAG: beta-lactamase family protein [Clostridia bacterium]|nr:beta-lactamase family protein [Clostridia bacterium]
MGTLLDCGFPAYDLVVTKDGKEVYHKCFGYSDAAKTKPTTSDDYYWIYSCTKTTTTAAGMKAIEMGLFKMDDPVSKYIPEFGKLKTFDENQNVIDCNDVMTIEHLFLMTAGLDYDRHAPKIKEVRKNKDATTLDVIRAIPDKPLQAAPGKRYIYSLCHDVLSAVIEVASGMKYSEFLHKYFWDPLGMKDTGFHPTEDQYKRFTNFYYYRNGSGEAIERQMDLGYWLTPLYESGGAGLFSTTNDQIKMMTMLANGGKAPDGTQLMKPETIIEMTKNRVSGDPLNGFVTNRLFGYGFGYGMRTHFDPIRSRSLSPVGEFGWDGAAGAFTMIDPFNHIACYFGLEIVNCFYAYYQAHPTIRNLIYKGIFEI